MTSEKQSAINNELASNDREDITAALVRLEEMLRSREADPSSLPFLTNLLEQDAQNIRRAALWSIGKLAQNKVLDEAPLDRLIDLLDDADEEVRENAAWTLGELAGVAGRKEAIGPLNRLLSDASPQVRGMAAWTLGRMAERMGLGHPSSVPLLEKLLDDRSLYVSKGAKLTLERLRSVL